VRGYSFFAAIMMRAQLLIAADLNRVNHVLIKKDIFDRNDHAYVLFDHYVKDFTLKGIKMPDIFCIIG